MSNKTVKVNKPETNSRLSKDAGKSTLAILSSKNALPADETNLIPVSDFKEALKVVNHEARFTVKTPEGDLDVDHCFKTESDLEANANVDSKNLEKAGALYQIPQTRTMLIKKAFLSELSNQLKSPKSRDYYASLLSDAERKKVSVQNLREAATFIRNINA